MTATRPETPAAPVATPVADPFGGSPENWSLPGCDWPPTDPEELAALDRWADQMEQEAAGRE